MTAWRLKTCPFCGKKPQVRDEPSRGGIGITQTAYDKIHRVDYSCSTHVDSVMILACKKCVQEQLKEEYERGKADGRADQRAEVNEENSLYENNCGCPICGNKHRVKEG